MDSFVHNFYLRQEPSSTLFLRNKNYSKREVTNDGLNKLKGSLKKMLVGFTRLEDPLEIRLKW
jgi:hypothetical protein